MGGLDDMIVSLYSGGMTVRNIKHHPVSTIGTVIRGQQPIRSLRVATSW